MKSFGMSSVPAGDEPLRALGELAEQAALWPGGNPEAELLPRLRVACNLPGSPWRLLGTEVQPDGVYAVDVVHSRPRSAALFADAIALLAAVAGPVFFVRHADAVTIDCVTGTLARDTPEPAHGYTLRLRLRDAGTDSTRARAAVRLVVPVPVSVR
ncbi:hypothetical protein [Streptomyces sp. SID3343]|uniref:hypothetical protein n=1 Tax=Streptomyces sp. SID3343 TaxID=2690260 RepID=UPI00136E3655|nr:hypothetical protein [Streptomyces sp. SID3343]MYW00027.1 hypothetical protein [Streptomyces sp. SID3343]